MRYELKDNFIIGTSQVSVYAKGNIYLLKDKFNNDKDDFTQHNYIIVGDQGDSYQCLQITSSIKKRDIFIPIVLGRKTSFINTSKLYQFTQAELSNGKYRGTIIDTFISKNNLINLALDMFMLNTNCIRQDAIADVKDNYDYYNELFDKYYGDIELYVDYKVSRTQEQLDSTEKRPRRVWGLEEADDYVDPNAAQMKKPGRPPKISDDMRKEIIKLRNEGLTLACIAESYNLSTTTISRITSQY